MTTSCHLSAIVSRNQQTLQNILKMQKDELEVYQADLLYFK